jgi:hypothetical protein
MEQSTSGSAKRNMNREDNEVLNWFGSYPGLYSKVQFLAWKHRLQVPLVKVKTHSTSMDSIPEVVVLPRAQWDVTTATMISDDVVLMARACMARSDFRTDDSYMVSICVELSISGTPYNCSTMRRFGITMHAMHSSVVTTLSADDYAAEVLRRTKDPNAVYVCLISLEGAAHLNGQEGVLNGHDPNCADRCAILLESGQLISVRSHNYQLVQRSKLYNDEF